MEYGLDKFDYIILEALKAAGAFTYRTSVGRDEIVQIAGIECSRSKIYTRFRILMGKGLLERGAGCGYGKADGYFITEKGLEALEEN